MDSSLGHDPATYQIPNSPDGTIDYKRAIAAKTNLKGRLLALSNFKKSAGRDSNIYLNQAMKNVVLDNAKYEREQAKKKNPSYF